MSVHEDMGASDPFRTPGNGFEDVEPFVIALVSSGAEFNWQTAKPIRALWLPEDFFGGFYRTARELRLPLSSTLSNLYSTYRFPSSDLARLAEEFSVIGGHVGYPLSEAARLAAALLREGLRFSTPVDVLIEGP